MIALTVGVNVRCVVAYRSLYIHGWLPLFVDSYHYVCSPCVRVSNIVWPYVYSRLLCCGVSIVFVL